MNALTEELRRLLEERLKTYQRLVSEIRDSLDDSRWGLRLALQLVADYPASVLESFEVEWDEAEPEYRFFVVRRHLKHLHETIDEIDDFLLRAVEADIPPALTAAVTRECGALLDDERVAVVTLGPADNFGTFIGDLGEWLVDGLTVDPEPQGQDDTRFALVQIPRLEGASAPWRPIVMGHEVAHLAVEERGFSEALGWPGAFPTDEASKVALPPGFDQPGLRADTLQEWAHSWLEELLCDAYALHRFGPAAIAGLGSFFETADAHASGATHPPGWLRVELMLEWIDDDGLGPVDAILAPWREVDPPLNIEPWESFLLETMRAVGPDIPTEIEQWNVPGYRAQDRIEVIAGCRDRLTSGLPAVVNPDDPGSLVDSSDVLNGGWLALMEGSNYPIKRLMDYSLEARDFIDRWNAATEDGQTALEPIMAAEDVEEHAFSGATLSADAIRERLAMEEPQRLIVTPLLRGAVDGSAIDLRLGNKFIVFRSSRIESFNPLSENVRAKAMQTYSEKSWGQPFVLHPNELVLANVLEYVSIPGDLQGQVLTRSSYGRLGLVTATATLVHPHYKGSLTLELVNLSEVPLSLTPGQRVAQLVLSQLDRMATEPDEEKKYRCPTGPEFSKVAEDKDRSALRRIRESRSD